MNLDQYFGTLAGMVALTLLVAGYLNTHIFTNSATWVKRVVSWTVPIILSFIGLWQHAGMFETVNALWTGIYGFATGLISNGVFDIAVIQAILEFIKAKKPEPKKNEFD